jgi:hypothetical protein
VPPCILSLPQLPNSFGRFIQPFTIRQTRNQLDGTKTLNGVRPRPAPWPQLARRAIQQLRHLGSQQPGRQASQYRSSPPGNSVKFFAALEVLEQAKDRAWLAKVTTALIH